MGVLKNLYAFSTIILLVTSLIKIVNTKCNWNYQQKKYNWNNQQQISLIVIEDAQLKLPIKMFIKITVKHLIKSSLSFFPDS